MGPNSNINDVIESLTTLQEVIITSWETKLRSSLPEWKQISKPILTDHLYEILDVLKKSLTENVEGEVEFLGKAHGLQRAYITNFNILDLLTEYRILREVLIYNLYPFGNLEVAQHLHKYIDILVHNAVAEFWDRKEVQHQSKSL